MMTTPHYQRRSQVYTEEKVLQEETKTAEELLKELPPDRLRWVDEQSIGLAENHPDLHERRIVFLRALCTATTAAIVESPNAKVLLRGLSQAASADERVSTLRKYFPALQPKGSSTNQC